jgi:gliding motility-associated-like protein
MVMKKTFLPILGLALMGFTASYAQSGSFDAKLSLKKLDCASRKIDVEVQVRSHEAGTIFQMGDANYRFAFNPSVIRNPDILSQENFSSQGKNPDANYGVQNLNGTVSRGTTGIVSLNTFYEGSDGGSRQVPLEWTPVSVLRFDISDIKSKIDLKWQNQEAFPSTGMSEVKAKASTSGDYDYDAFEIKHSAGFVHFSLDLSAACPANLLNSEVTPAQEFFISEGFSPDGDGVNDKFLVKNPEKLGIEIQVFDRHGSLVYQNDQYQSEWDGRPNVSGWNTSKTVEAGTYYYVIRRSDGKQYTRFMTISY